MSAHAYTRDGDSCGHIEIYYDSYEPWWDPVGEPDFFFFVFACIHLYTFKYFIGAHAAHVRTAINRANGLIF